jgi:hypothetical protein
MKTPKSNYSLNERVNFQKAILILIFFGLIALLVKQYGELQEKVALEHPTHHIQSR